MKQATVAPFDLPSLVLLGTTTYILNWQIEHNQKKNYFLLSLAYPARLRRHSLINSYLQYHRLWITNPPLIGDSLDLKHLELDREAKVPFEEFQAVVL
jgi:hypothetical protein